MTPKPKTAALSVVDKTEENPVEAPPQPAIVDEKALGAVEQAMQEFAKEQRPMIRRSEMRRQRIAADVKEVESGLNDLAEREKLLDRLVEAGKLAIKQQREDLEEELALLQRGIVGSVEVQADGR